MCSSDLDANTTRYYLRTYHRIRNPVLAWPVEAILRLSTRTILNQDRAIVVTQTPANSMNADADRLVGADRAISQFRRLHAQLLNGETGLAEHSAMLMAN